MDWETGEVIGEHEGMEVLTIGQKARIGGCREKYYIVGKCVTSVDALYVNGDKRMKGDVFVVNGKDHPILYTEGLSIPIESFYWIRNAFHNSNPEDNTNTKFTFKTRHGQRIDKCHVKLNAKEGVLEVTFDVPQRALTAGQIFALYDKHAEECLGAAPIPLINLS